MSFVVECPACGESENLSGTQSADGITITCNACTTSWLRDSSRHCATGGGTDIAFRPRAMRQISRGTLLSIVGWANIPCCMVCDATAVERSFFTGGPLPADYTSLAMHPTDKDTPT